jgi:uncharacterized membrane protein
MTAPVEAPLLRVEIRPQRSVSVRAIDRLALVLLPMFVAPSVGFALTGAWPVAGFLSLDFVLLYGALRWNAWGGHALECIEIGETGAIVKRTTSWGRETTWVVPANWLQIAVHGRPGNDGGVEISANANRTLVGRWLASDERRDLAEALRAAVLDLRRAPHNRLALDDLVGDEMADGAACPRLIRYPRSRTSAML